MENSSVYIFVYKTTNLINNKIYVGKHLQYETSAFDGYLGSGKILKLAFKKYGREHFIRETIDHCTSANVDEREIYWISELSTTNPLIGYNITSGGEGNLGLKHSYETKRKMSMRRKGIRFSEERKINMRQPRSEEHKKHISESQKGKILSEEHIINISKSKKGKKESYVWDTSYRKIQKTYK